MCFEGGLEKVGLVKRRNALLGGERKKLAIAMVKKLIGRASGLANFPLITCSCTKAVHLLEDNDDDKVGRLIASNGNANG